MNREQNDAPAPPSPPDSPPARPAAYLDSSAETVLPSGLPPPRPTPYSQLQPPPPVEPELDAVVRQAAADPTRRIGRYALLSELGRGGMGVVHRAFDLQLHRPVAIKMIRDARFAGPQQLARFRSEARLTARLRHGGIVTLHEVGEHEARPYLVMDFVPGEPLSALLAKGRMAPRRAATIVRELAEALHYAHGEGVVHRDVKPPNVIIDADGRPRVMDFGLARDVGAKKHLTGTGQVLGTPAYMAPEQVDAEHDKHGPPTDVWALGVILYEAITGRRPFEGKLPLAIVAKVLNAEPAPPRKLDPRIHLDLETIALKCLEKTPERRYPSAGALASDLRRFLQGEAISARPPGRRERAARWVRRNRLLSAGIAIVLALSAAGLAVGARAVRNARAQERLGLIAEARRDAEEAWGHFAKRRATTDPAQPQDQDQLYALGHAAHQAAERWRVLTPRDAEAASASTRAALALAEVATRAGQWSLAASVLSEAGKLGQGGSALADATRRLEAERTRLQRERRERITQILDQARRGDLIDRESSYAEALHMIVSLKDEQTVGLLTDALDEVSRELRTVREKLLQAAAEPTPDEARTGERAIGKIDEALSAAQRLPAGEPLPAELEASLEKARRRLERRDNRSKRAPHFRTEIVRQRTAREIIASAQERHLGEGTVLLTRLCCEALGFLKMRADAGPALTRYLIAEESELRAAHAGIALCMLGAEDGTQLLRFLRERFGVEGAFWQRVGRYSTRVTERSPTTPQPAPSPGDSPPGRDQAAEAAALAGLDRAIEIGRTEKSAATASIERARAALQRGEIAETIAELDRAVELAPSRSFSWQARGNLRLHASDPAGAISDLTRAIEIAPNDALSWSMRAHAHIVAGNPREARGDSTHAMQLDPLLALPWTVRGSAQEILGDLQDAISDYTRAIELDPNAAAAWSGRGRARAAKGDPGALADCDRAIEIAPSDAAAWAARADVRRVRGDATGAIADYGRALELVPDSIVALNNRAIVYNALGDREAAIADYTRVIELAPAQGLVWVNRGDARRAIGDLVGAISDFDRAIELDPTNTTTRRLRAMARREAGDLGGALSDLNAAIEIDPTDVAVRVEHGRLLLQRGEIAAGFLELNRAVEAAPSYVETWFARGAARYAVGDVVGAISDLSRAIELEPGRPHSWLIRGDAHAAKGDLAASLADYDKAIELNPRFGTAFVNRGARRKEAGDLGGALADFERAIELRPNDERAWFNRGLVRQAAGLLDASIADFGRALTIRPDFAEALNDRAVSRMRKGELAGAVTDLDRAIELIPNSAAYHQNRGTALSLMNEHTAAIRDYDRAIELNPKSAEVWFDRGATRLVTGDRAGAIQDFERFLELKPEGEASRAARQTIDQLRGQR